MALKLFTLLFILLSFFSLQSAHGRENFSKFPHVVNSQINEKTNKNNIVNETVVVPNNVDPLNKQNQEDQDPTFIPETQNAYGLYGRGNVPTEKTTTYTEENNDNSYYSNNNNNNNDEYENGVQEDMITDTSLMGSAYTTPMSSRGYQSRGYRNGYNTDEQGNREEQYKKGETMYSSEEELDNSKLYDKRYNSNNPYRVENRYNSNQHDTENKYNYDVEYYNSENKFNNDNQQQNNNGANKYNNNEQQNYYNGANKYNSEQQNYNGANKYNNNAQQSYNGVHKYSTEKQGMSDTRFLENGRYFHDINNEKNNYRRDYNTEQYGSSNENGYEFDRSGVNEYKNQYP